MGRRYYPKLAWTGIKKNKRFYLPYFLTCMGMVMMFYIISFLSTSAAVKQMRGGEELQMILGFGVGVMAVFSVIFLFYTNSFLIRRRKREFGLYNILGMGKRNIAGILCWESVFVGAGSILSGLALGIILSKLAELVVCNLLNGQADFSLHIELGAVVSTGILYAAIFVLLLLNTLRQVYLASPIALLRSDSAGEKPPKANWVFALLGVALLGVAYYLAVSIEDPMMALMVFFIAVCMVILATYLLFITGSVALCKLLQKNKRYYYKTNHFVSVSNMGYRMKRNGAGLASICILCTMVLVMLSSTVCLYIGAEDSLRSRYPRNLSIEVQMRDDAMLEEAEQEALRAVPAQCLQARGLTPENTLDYVSASTAAYIDKTGYAEMDLDKLDQFQLDTYSDVWQIFLISLDDYNRLMGQSETLEPGEALLYTTKASYTGSTLTIGPSAPIHIKATVPSFIDNSIDAVQVIPSLFLFVPDLEAQIAPLTDLRTASDLPLLSLDWYYGFDLSCDDETQIAVYRDMQAALKPYSVQLENENCSIDGNCAAAEREDFYGTFGSLFFLGVLLGAVFVLAAVLIMYYKQVSEGYEDQDRFDIMQKVGMTKQEIRKSINSQVLTVFFAPLLLAGLHLAFAFPLIRKLLLLFGLSNLRLLVLVTVLCYLAFAILYTLVYRVTSRSYYTIVSDAHRQEE